MCSFTLNSWNGGAIHETNPEPGVQPARVKLEWNEKYGGSRDTILRLIAVYRSLGLVEYTPVAN
jgi:hypothetical protein